MYDPHVRVPTRIAAANAPLSRGPRVRALALGLSAALAMPLAIQQAAASHAPASGMPQYLEMPKAPLHPSGQTRTVKNCDDSGTDSLRDIITNPNSPNHAQTGDTVDLSQLPTLCGMTPSVITLGSEIVVAQDDLTIQGPSTGSVTISGAGMSRVFHHSGAGTLALNAMTVTDGYYHATVNAYGGCIESDGGNLFLSHVTVSQCTVASDGGFGNGGGISAHLGEITLIASRVVENQASGGTEYNGWGGGIYSGGNTLAFYSSISGNTAHQDGVGGGIATHGSCTAVSSTIDNNAGGYGGGLRATGSAILNSTISRNTASMQGGGVWVYGPATIGNSTIAFNQNVAANGEGGVYFRSSPPGNDALTLQSSIIADNTAGTASPSDLYLGFGTLAGTDNLVIAANVFNPVVITVTDDPKLGPLQFHGGRTQTHVPLPGSPALGKGNLNALSPPWNTTDQRGIGYPRTTGPNASVDLGAVQFDSIFADNFDAFY
jgi:hypothetical protein